MALGATLAGVFTLFLALGATGTLWGGLSMLAATTVLGGASTWLIERIAGQKRDPLMTTCYVVGFGLPVAIALYWYIA